jgi:hypothetical protein
LAHNVERDRRRRHEALAQIAVRQLHSQQVPQQCKYGRLHILLLLLLLLR